MTQFRWTSTSNTYTKDLSWLHFEDEPRVQKRQQVKDEQSCMSVFVCSLSYSNSKKQLGGVPAQTWKEYGRMVDLAIEIQSNHSRKKRGEWIEAPIFLEAVLAIEIKLQIPSPQCLVDQIQVKLPILIVATDQMPGHILSRESSIISIDSNIISRVKLYIDSLVKKVRESIYS